MFVKKYMQKLDNKNVPELMKVIRDGKKDLYHLRIQKKVGSLKQTHKIFQTKKNIARAKLVLSTKLSS